MKPTASQVAARFGCTVEQVKNQARDNLARLDIDVAQYARTLHNVRGFALAEMQRNRATLVAIIESV